MVLRRYLDNSRKISCCPFSLFSVNTVLELDLDLLLTYYMTVSCKVLCSYVEILVFDAHFVLQKALS